MDGSAMHLGKVADDEFEDLSSRAHIFRSKLIDEFHLDETVSYAAGKSTDPKYSTSELISPDESESSVYFTHLLRNNPHQLVKFKIFKRSQESNFTQDPQKKNADKRLARVRSMHSIPLAVWAHWITTHPYFTSAIFWLIVMNAIIQGLQTELTRESFPVTYDFMDVFDDITLLVFSIEIVLKWLDSFRQFWWDGWNVFDFVVTALSAVPRLLSLILASSSGSLQSISNQLRLFRTLRILKMVARLSSLRVVISTVIEAFQSLGFILLLLLLLTYIFSIFAINLFEAYTTSTNPELKFRSKFSDIPHTFGTLFQLLTLDQWYAIQQDVRKEVSSFLTIIFFLCWVCIGAFIFRNVFVGVMVRKFDQMSAEARRLEAEEQRERKQSERLQELNKKLEDKEAQGTPKRGAGRAYGTQIGAGGANSNVKNRINLKMQREFTDMERWYETVNETLVALEQEKAQYMWPRDLLLRYLVTMQRLQNNAKEYEELQYLAAAALHQVYGGS